MLIGIKDLLFDSLEDGASSGLSDDVKLLSEDDQQQEENQEQEEQESQEEEEQEQEGQEEEEEQEEQEEKQEAKSDLLPHERPTYTDLKTSFPDLFKKFPSLKDVIFREKAYTELYTTLEDARTAQQDAQAFSTARNSILSGDSTDLLKGVKESGEQNLKRFAANFLPSLYKVDQDAHWAAAVPLLENMVKGLLRSAPDNEDVQKAAQTMANFLFGQDGKDILDGKKTFVEKLETKKVDPEREKFEKERYDAFSNDIDSDAKGQLNSLILAKDKNGNLRLDPDGVFSEWMKKTLIEKISSTVNDEMSADKAHLSYMNSLWDKAKKDGYTREWKSRIISAYLARARQLVPAVRSRLVSEALGTSIRRSGKTKEVVDRNRPTRNSPQRGSKNNGSFQSGRAIDYSKTSDDDIINDNITYK